jgi:hypothetical protein
LTRALIGVPHQGARDKARAFSTQAEITQNKEDDDNDAYKPDQSIHDAKPFVH